MTSVNIDLNLVKACALACSKEETRYYLNGVFIQYDGHALVSVATDGHRLVAFKHDCAQDNALESFGVIIPRAIINAIKLAKHGTIARLYHVNGLKWTIEYNGQAVTFDAIDGIFPDWKRVVPSKTSGEIAQFNLEYMADFAKITKLLGKNAPHCAIAHNGHGPALVSFNSDFDGFGVLMPVRMETPIKSAPSWVNPYKLDLPETAKESHESVAA
jgi:DNA polymerase-3 subunit beta